MHTQDSPRLLRLPEVMQRTGLTRSAVYRQEAGGTFPRRVSISDSSRAWLEAEVEEWIIDRLAARDAQEIAA